MVNPKQPPTPTQPKIPEQPATTVVVQQAGSNEVSADIKPGEAVVAIQHATGGPEVANVKPGSKSLRLDTTDLQKIVIGAAVAVAGALLTYAVDKLLPDLQNKDVINATMFVVLTTVLNALQKFLRDKSDTLTKV